MGGCTRAPPGATSTELRSCTQCVLTSRCAPTPGGQRQTCLGSCRRSFEAGSSKEDGKDAAQMQQQGLCSVVVQQQQQQPQRSRGSGCQGEVDTASLTVEAIYHDLKRQLLYNPPPAVIPVAGAPQQPSATPAASTRLPQPGQASAPQPGANVDPEYYLLTIQVTARLADSSESWMPFNALLCSLICTGPLFLLYRAAYSLHSNRGGLNKASGNLVPSSRRPQASIQHVAPTLLNVARALVVSIAVQIGGPDAAATPVLINSTEDILAAWLNYSSLNCKVVEAANVTQCFNGSPAPAPTLTSIYLPPSTGTPPDFVEALS